MDYDHPKQPIDGSFAPLGDTLWEARERQRFADMQRGMNTLSDTIEDLCHPERKAQRIQAEMERKFAKACEDAVSLSNRKLLEEIYVMLKMKHFVI